MDSEERPSERPPVWIGHVSLQSVDVPKTCDCLVELGMRVIVRKESFAVLELRGGTHLVLRESEEPPEPHSRAPFDLMYEDIPAIWKRCEELGYKPTEPDEGKIHTSFTIVEPGGYEIKINSSHAGDRAV